MITINCGYFEEFDQYSYYEPSLQIKLFDVSVDVNKNIFIFTNSPYILNYLNLCILRFDKNINDFKINFDNLEVIYTDENGCKESLKCTNIRLINTNMYSDVINWIYDEYDKLNKYELPNEKL